MDNVTHSLTGLALARAGLDRFSPRATLLLLLSANAPDCDIVALARGQLAYLEAHRGYTHSLLFLPVLALVCVLVTAAVYREKLPWVRAWALCVIGLSSHLAACKIASAKRWRLNGVHMPSGCGAYQP